MRPGYSPAAALSGFHDPLVLDVCLQPGGAEIFLQFAAGSAGAGDLAFGLMMQIVERIRPVGWHRMPP
jgi:hypothetical protein